MPAPALAINLTWSPAESGITDIASYSIFRAVDGGASTLLINCPVLRDFLGGIIGVQNCTTVPNIPTNDDSGSVYDKTVPDAPITYVDTAVSIGHQYCYQITAIPMGNNQAVAQGPPNNSNVACTTPTLVAPSLGGLQDPVGGGVVLQWGLPVGEYLDVTGWTVQRSVNSGAFSVLASVGANQLSLEDTAVSTGNTYSYFVTYTAFATASAQSLVFTISL